VNQERVRFELLLPFYVNVTLDVDDHAFVKAYLDKNPQAMRQLKLAELMQAAAAHQSSDEPDERRVSQFMARWQTATSHTQGASNARLPQSGWFQGLMRPSLVALATLTIAASVAFVEVPDSRVLHPDLLDGRPDLLVTLAQGVGADDPDLQLALSEAGGVILQQHTSEQGHELQIDLPHRAKTQANLIERLRQDNKLQSYALLGDEQGA
jgi:hypothetical protein